MIGESYKRWRHLRGYGVHSPSAYRFVTEVLNPRHGYGYYAYRDIPPTLWLLYRVAVALWPDSVQVDMTDAVVADAVERVVKMARHDTVDGLSGESSLLIADGSRALPQGWKNAIFTDLRPQCVRRLLDNPPEHVHIFRGRHAAIVVSNPAAPTQTFTVALPRLYR